MLSKQTAKKAVGPVRPLLPREIQTLRIKDHDDGEILLFWRPDQYSDNPPEKVPPFPYQVYVTDGAKDVADDPGFPTTFIAAIESLGDFEDKRSIRFELYNKTHPLNILSCIAHQRKEVVHRNRNGIWPRLLQSWSHQRDADYDGRLIVIDRLDWRDNDLVLVSYDPKALCQPGASHRSREWWEAGEGDFPMVRAERCKLHGRLLTELERWRQAAGHEWADADLERRNDGGFSPALYPAVDPAAHNDVEHDDTIELNATPLAGPVMPNGQAVDWEDLPHIIDVFDRGLPYQRDRELTQFKSESYSDSFGLPVTSVWNPSFSILRPDFAVTLYVASDFFPVHAKALFASLDQGLLANVAWTLDVIYNIPTLEDAFEYHTRASRRRSPEKTTSVSDYVDMILRRAAGGSLPDELTEYIKRLTVPPLIPSFTGRPIRPFQHMFLYLNTNSMKTGPTIIYSNPAEFWTEAYLTPSSMENASSADWERKTPQAFTSMDILIVSFLRFWHRVSNELHIIFSVSSPRLLLEPHQLPSITMRVQGPEILEVAEHTKFTGNAIKMQMLLSAEAPITIHLPGNARSIWADSMKITDSSTQLVIPSWRSRCHWSLYHYADSWARTPELGFEPDRPGQSLHSLVLEPDVWTTIDRQLVQRWWYDYGFGHRAVDGHRYTFTVKPGATIPFWTWGICDEQKGPYNLPPIPVSIEREAVLTARIVPNAAQLRGSGFGFGGS